jgi:hypothetical protein
LERKIKRLEKEVLEYIRKAKELNKKRKITEGSHIRRTLSLMHIIEEQDREIKELKRSDAGELGLISRRLQERIKESNCLYDISSFRDATDFSMEVVLQAVVDFIPPAIQFPEITCARVIFGDYEIKTKNFRDTKWKISCEIAVTDKWTGTLEVCSLEEKPELDEGPFGNFPYGNILLCKRYNRVSFVLVNGSNWLRLKDAAGGSWRYPIER